MTSFRVPGAAHSPSLPAPNVAQQIANADVLAGIVQAMPPGLSRDEVRQHLMTALDEQGLTIAPALHTMAKNVEPSPRCTFTRRV